MILYYIVTDLKSFNYRIYNYIEYSIDESIDA